MREREIETLRKPYEPAVFVATETFDAAIDPVLELDIQDHESGRTDPDDTTEATARVTSNRAPDLDFGGNDGDDEDETPKARPRSKDGVSGEPTDQSAPAGAEEPSEGKSARIRLDHAVDTPLSK